MDKKTTIPVKIKIQNKDFDVSEETKILRQNETGAIVNVPLFINEGDKVKIDTEKGQYLERIK